MFTFITKLVVLPNIVEKPRACSELSGLGSSSKHQQFSFTESTFETAIYVV